MWNSIAWLVVGLFFGAVLMTLIIVIKDPKKPIEHIHVGSLKIVKNKDGSLETMFVDFNNPPDCFVQDQIIDLSIDIIDLDSTTEIESRFSQTL